jgi:hypothetical protein
VVDAGQPQLGQGADIQVKQDNGSLMNVKAGANLADVVKALNALGANPLDLLAILQAMKAAGACAPTLKSSDSGMSIKIQTQPNRAALMSGRLRICAASSKDPQEGLKAAAQQFETLFLQMVMKSMRDAYPMTGC